MKRINRSQKVLCIVKVILISLWVSVSPISITDMHGSWDVLSDNAKHCSPLVGAIYWETNYLKKLYYFGNALQTSSKDGLTFEGDKTIEVIHRLFHEVGGSFSISTNKDFVAAHLSSEILGDIIGILESSDRDKPENLMDKLVTVFTNDPGYQYSINAEGVLRPNTLGSKAFSTKLQKKRVEALCKAIIESLGEQGFEDDKRYPLYTTHAILLAAVYRLADNRRDLQNYFEALNKYSPSDQPFFDKDLFGTTVAYDIQELEAMYEIPFTQEIFEKYIIGGLVSFYRQSLPKIFEYKPVNYQNIRYPNCVETTVRNLCNIVLYNASTGTFDIEKISSLDDKVKEFYRKNNRSEYADQISAHQAWVGKPENQSFIIYNNCIKDGTSVSIDGKFMRVTSLFMEKNKKIINQDGITVEQPFPYIVLKFAEKPIKLYLVLACQATCYLYNMRASLTNVIIQLNRLLGLNLFDNLEEQMLDQTFNEIYFPKLITKLGWTLEGEYKDWMAIGWKASVALKLSVKDAPFFINLSSGHGYVSIPAFKSLFSPVKVEELQRNWVRGICALVVGIDRSDKFIGNIGTKIQYYFMNDLFNDSEKITFLEALTDKEKGILRYSLNRMADQLEVTGDYNYQVEFLRLLRDENIEHHQSFFKRMIDGAAIAVKSSDRYERCSGLRLYEALVAKGKGFEVAIKAAGEAVKSFDRDEQNSGLNLYKVLFARGQAFEDAIKAAGEAVKSSGRDEQNSGLKLYEALVAKGKDFEAAIKAAGEAVKSSDWSVRSSGLELYKKLFALEKGFEAAIKAAGDGVKSSDWPVQVFVLRLYKELFAKGQGFEAAIEAAGEAVKSSNEHERSIGLDLYAVLVAEGRAFEDAVKAAGEAVKDERYSGLNLYKALVTQGQGFDAAIEAAGKAVKSSDKCEHSSGLDLYAVLVPEGRAFEDAIQAAAEAVKSLEESIQMSGLDLYTALVTQGQGFETAIEVAGEAVKSSDMDMQDSGLELYKELFAKGQGFEAAIKAAEEITRPNFVKKQLFDAVAKYRKGDGDVTNVTL